MHNHPNGNPEADIHIINKIVEICQPVNIIVHDHVSCIK